MAKQGIVQDIKGSSALLPYTWRGDGHCNLQLLPGEELCALKAKSPPLATSGSTALGPFQPSFLSMESGSIHETTFNFIVRCDIDVHNM